MQPSDQKCENCDNAATVFFADAEHGWHAGYLCDFHSSELQKRKFSGLTAIENSVVSPIRFEVFFLLVMNERWQLFLREKAGNRSFCFDTGPYEWTSLYHQLIQPGPISRTIHGAVCTIVNELGGQLTRLVIDRASLDSDLINAKLELQQGNEAKYIDIRATDGITLAVVNGVEIEVVSGVENGQLSVFANDG